MKHSIKQVFLCLLAVLFSGCLPHEPITGRVISTAGPVPQAAVLAMVWIEDADKVKLEPDVKNLNPEERGAAYDKDMQERGLPLAYTRAFSDKDGLFTLDKLFFSAETKKAVKAMRQPRITRITLNAFQRGYIKHAVTIFVKDTERELPPATITLSKPDNWKQLALDNYFRTLRRDEYDYGYSKAFGATKEEKEWFLSYTQSNLSNAYAESNIKGDKQWEENCGHDYSDVMVSTAGMQRNPTHEKCADLLHQVSVLRDWKDQWLDHAMAVNETPEPAVNAVKAAVEALGPEYAEVKANETLIVAGVTEAADQYRKGRTNQELSDKPTTAEPQRLYNIGDKAGAYKALGYVLCQQLPGEIKQGILTAQIPATAIPGIRDTAAGFYLLMNRPQSAQLPNGDNGDHKDKPGYKVGDSTDTGGNSSTVTAEVRNGHIERASEKGHDVVLFLDKDNKKIRELILGETETQVRINKSKKFDAAGFKVKVSSTVAEEIEAKRKKSNRDIRFTRQSTKEAYSSKNGRFLAVEDSHLDFVEFADANDGEMAEEPIENDGVTTIYGADGTKIHELNRSEGWQPVVSNTGQFFVVTIGEYEKQRILDQEKNILVEVPYHHGNKMFSPNDRFILLEDHSQDSDVSEITVYDTKTNKLELRKTSVPWETFSEVENMEISEEHRTITIKHIWSPATHQFKTDTVRF